MTDKRAYDNTRRKQAQILRAMQRALTEEPPDAREPKGRRRLRRDQRFEKIPRNLVCPKCGVRNTTSKSWVVGKALTRGLPVQCKTCWTALLKEGPLPPEIVGIESDLEKARREAEGLPPPAVNGSKLPQFIHDLASGKLTTPVVPAEPKIKVDTTSF